MGVIYCFTNLINNKKYIGQTINDPKIRYNAHKSAVYNEKNSEYYSPLHAAMRKYGFDNFSYKILIQNIENIEELNALEIFYINFFNTQIPNGYNIESGGKNCKRPQTQQHKENECWSHSIFTEKEIIQLRIAYKNNESPKEIYDKLYQERISFQSFMNIWTGKRYSFVMPEVFENRSKKTKLNFELAKQIRKEYAETKISHQKLAKKYGVGCIDYPLGLLDGGVGILLIHISKRYPIKLKQFYSKRQSTLIEI